jgi:serine/threonine-protein phosphatase 2B regulatory subunit
MTEAIKSHTSQSIASLELSKVRELYHINFNDAKHLLKRFSVMASKRNGMISLDEFCKGLGLPKDSVTEELFNAFDIDGSGFIDFKVRNSRISLYLTNLRLKEFVVGLSVISNNVNFKETVQLCFKALDQNSDGRIDIDEMRNIFRRLFSNIEDHVVESLFNKIDLDGDKTISKGKVHVCCD